MSCPFPGHELGPQPCPRLAMGPQAEKAILRGVALVTVSQGDGLFSETKSWSPGKRLEKELPCLMAVF